MLGPLQILTCEPNVRAWYLTYLIATDLFGNHWTVAVALGTVAQNDLSGRPLPCWPCCHLLPWVPFPCRAASPLLLLDNPLCCLFCRLKNLSSLAWRNRKLNRCSLSNPAQSVCSFLFDSSCCAFSYIIWEPRTALPLESKTVSECSSSGD